MVTQASQARRICEARWLGTVQYDDGLRLQERAVERLRSGDAPEQLLLLEHPHVFTLGRGADKSNILADPQQLESNSVEVHETGRGGDVTYHGPGQLVVYPIVDLRSKLRKDVHSYVRNLEQCAIQTLADFGIATMRRPPHTGIWINGRKIAAIGVAVRRCITYHGLAINVNTDLSYFQRIIPCGLAWAEVTSMQKELSVEQNPSQVRARFLHHFADIFGYDDVVAAGQQSDDLNVLNGLNDLNS